MEDYWQNKFQNPNGDSDFFPACKHDVGIISSFHHFIISSFHHFDLVFALLASSVTVAAVPDRVVCTLDPSR